MAVSVRVTVPATTANLGAGCDCAGLALALYNKVALTVAGEGLRITVKGEGEKNIPRDERNLVYQAARRVWNTTGFPVPAGVQITLENAIPVGAGLGSSAAAIIGGMLAANAAGGAKLTLQEVLDLAAALEGHPDNVAAALYGGAVVAVVEGKRVLTLRFPVAAELRAVVAVPAFSLPTAQSRRVLPPSYVREEVLFNVARAALLAGALACGRYDLLRVAMQDRLYQPYRAPLVPGLNEVLAAALKAGACGVALSGAGPAVVALTTQDAAAVGDAMEAAFGAAGVQARVLILQPDAAGARVEQF
ncbi:homoserine kinase [Thermodesulfitimonas autotrophica]|uniref:Homoserine kinase n=1 Tax=Thermodesulfitimonas autotrophica TaxID=1894989 RepID=A0A3N5AEG5_9THEO|nr:homoserine kinase [Thermodesulfitimonas autotrophica]RPF43034.1 homoserine kinase [Thermodesulfitimonas autotrophica]